MDQTIFLLLIRSEAGESQAHTVIESLRTFGGPLSQAPVWVFVLDPAWASQVLPGVEAVHRHPLILEGNAPVYPFAEKVAVCEQAEAMAGPEVRSLVLLSLDCLVIKPPSLFDLSSSTGAVPADAAFRPVHHRNIGSPASEPLDDYWRGIYHVLEVEEMGHTVESFADGQILRPYFNTHCFAFNPGLGLMQDWWRYFKTLVADQDFQDGPCADPLHQIFLHQAVLSTLIAKKINWERVRLLPPAYNFPLNLLDEMPPEKQPDTLNSLVNAVYEEAFPWGKVTIRAPLRTWLHERLPMR